MPRHPRESHKIDIEYLPERILQDPSHKSIPRELSHKHLQYRSKIFTQGPLRGFHQDLQKTVSQGPLQDLGQDLHVRIPTSTLWNSGQMVLSISLPGTLKISQNEHRATTRAIWHARHKVMRWWRKHISEFHQSCAHHEKRKFKVWNRMFYLDLRTFLLISTKFCACQKNEPETSEALRLPR